MATDGRPKSIRLEAALAGSHPLTSREVIRYSCQLTGIPNQSVPSMDVVFVATQSLPFHSNSLNERPLGGTETAVIRLSEALHRRKHSVTVVTSHPEPPLSVPRYISFQQGRKLTACDVLIAVRGWQPVFWPLSASLRLFWTGDSFDAFPTLGIGDVRVENRLDALLAVSDWQAGVLCSQSGFPRTKVWVIRNGVHLQDFSGEESRVRKRLIYSSTPLRGLAHVPALYRRLKGLHPDAELHVFSGYQVYDAGRGYDPTHEERWREMSAELNQLPDCHVQSNVVQSRLAREFMRSAVLFYPNNFDETSCITAMEAQAAGCAIVTSSRAALPETVGQAGILIEGVPGSVDFETQFVGATDRLLTDEPLFRACSEEGRRRARESFDWNVVAERFDNFLTAELDRKAREPHTAVQ
jgi:glycosyltransferase involved in cell wall biosynthesis